MTSNNIETITNLKIWGENPLRFTTQDENDLFLIKVIFYSMFWSLEKIMTQKLSNILERLYFKPL
jgi:hypothetical protein